MKKRNYARVKDPTNEPRDRWIYWQCCAGVPYPAIVAALKEKADANGWTAVTSHQGFTPPRTAMRNATGCPDLRPGPIRTTARPNVAGERLPRPAHPLQGLNSHPELLRHGGTIRGEAVPPDSTAQPNAHEHLRGFTGRLPYL